MGVQIGGRLKRMVDWTEQESAPQCEVGAYGWSHEAKQSSCKGGGRQKATEATLQDEIGEPIKRSVDGSAMATVALEEQRTANGLNNPLNNPLHFQEDGLQHRS